ncbi:MAG: hypothetical protein LBP62_02935 [Clostridiales bacterium]|jgi:hypothetical protein|nr:hypothetical protein [Clostridiales bacterium]
MAGKVCQICGHPSGMYPICVNCFKLRDSGEVVQCPDCKIWYKAKDGHKCNPEIKVEKTIIEKTEKRIYKPEQYTKQVIIKREDFSNDDPRKKWEAAHQCDDGHYVRSYSEVIIDNWLYHNGYVHAYEKSVFLPKNPDENVLSDFYLPNNDIYIEFWGVKNNDYYANRKEYKISLYENNGFNLINLEEDDIKRLNDKMPRLIFNYSKK